MTDDERNPDPAADLTRYRWDKRVVLVFAGGAGERFERQRALFERERRGLDDRDMVVVALAERSGEGPDGPLGAAATRALRGRFRPDGFEVVLVGKDGGEKERWGEPVEPTTLFGVVDAMPMRRREMREDDEG